MPGKPLAVQILDEIAAWNMRCVEPTHIVMAFDVLEEIAAQQDYRGFIGRSPKLWGLPIIVAGITGWAVGTERPLDARRGAESGT